MSRIIGEHYEGDVRVRYVQHGDDLTVERHQDAQAVVDQVAAMNSHGVRTLDGLGKPVAEVPLVAMMDYCAARGIPWERMAYSNDYDTEFRAFVAEHRKLQYEASKAHFAVSA